ncbi:hypothetical protein, partial [Lacticaseibacillus pantheris]|uniref:hypothetical protein n=1 Tax=Lacticaseibacillus pantheris TaxID=171523 RepID=UPI001CDB0B05
EFPVRLGACPYLAGRLQARRVLTAKAVRTLHSGSGHNSGFSRLHPTTTLPAPVNSGVPI